MAEPLTPTLSPPGRGEGEEHESAEAGAGDGRLGHAHGRRGRRGRHWERHGWHGGPHWWFGAALHRRLFWWFGGAILCSGLAVMVVFRATGGPQGGHRLWALLAAGAALWMLSGRIARRVAWPLARLVEVTQEIGRGNLSARVRDARGWHGSHVFEIQVLGRAIDDMADRIARQIGEQRELLAGVSHEIRTPLARMRILLELGRDHGADGKTLEELEREVIEIDALCGELLASARLDFSALERRPLDGVESARRAAERAGVAPGLVRAQSDDARFAGDPTLVARALANLIGNARKHAGGLEALVVRREPGFVVFEALDRGPGFPAGEEARVFQSFYRGSDERERPEGSLGLGLSLVRRIARAHGGDATAANRDGGGARVTVSFAVGDRVVG